MIGVIYARYSSDNQREESIEGQLRECRQYADRNGITLLDPYIDRAYSAKTDNRPSFLKMVKDSAAKKFDTIIVWKLDRFARNRYDSAHYKSILRKNGVRVVSATESISEGSEGILLESVLEGMAEYYSADLAQKVIRGLTENALKCKYNGGTLPIGYVIDSAQYFQIDPRGSTLLFGASQPQNCHRLSAFARHQRLSVRCPEPCEVVSRQKCYDQSAGIQQDNNILYPKAHPAGNDRK